MHPDEATEPIVDMALAHGKPFAVVPCCVFAREAARAGRDRRTPAGEPVATYEQLLDYLAAKDAGIRRAFLGFKGRNAVLFHRGAPGGPAAQAAAARAARAARASSPTSTRAS